MLQLNLELPRKKFIITVNLTVKQGQVLCLFGPSATGKSSILSMIAGFDTGFRNAFLSINNKVLVDNHSRPKISIPPWDRKIGYMEQTARLFPHLNVEKNILYGVSDNYDKAWVNRTIESVGLKDALLMRPDQLSGGMAQRVALARALAAKPNVLLLDEPFSALDWDSRRLLQDLVRDVNKEFSITMILVTHQLSEAQRMADKIALIDQGMILQTGSPDELINNPNSGQAARLMGYTSTIHKGDGNMFLVHPDRVVLGSKPDMGIPIEAHIKEVRWYEGRQRIQISLCPPWYSSEDLEVNLPPIHDIYPRENIQITITHPIEY